MTEYDELRDAQLDAEKQRFKVIEEGRYELDIPEWQMVFQVDRLRRERQHLLGELTVRCDIPGCGAVKDNIISISDMNFSSARAKEDKQRYLVRRVKCADEIPFLKLLEELSINVTMADRDGSPGVDLRTIPLPEADDKTEVDGLVLPKRHPTILFGDGGSAKSYFALYYLGRMALNGAKVAFFDWELDGGDHRQRLELLFGASAPLITYMRCERPLVSEIDRLRRTVKDDGITFALFDSIAVACDGPPESAEISSKYFRAVRQLGAIGTIHIAHISKSEGGDKKPFGSAFWHNSARSTWFVKKSDEAQRKHSVQIGLYHRKANLGPIQQPLGFDFSFGRDQTTVSRVDMTEIPELADNMTVRQRMETELSDGSMTLEKLSYAIDAGKETIRKTIRRNPNNFILLEGGYVGAKQPE